MTHDARIVCTTFIVPSHKFDWVAIELIDNYENYCDSYVLIDDVSILPGCSNERSSIAGVKGVCCNNIHSELMPLIFYGLKNLTHFMIRIYSITGSLIGTPINITNPPDIIAWVRKNIVLNCHLQFNMNMN